MGNRESGTGIRGRRAVRGGTREPFAPLVRPSVRKRPNVKEQAMGWGRKTGLATLGAALAGLLISCAGGDRAGRQWAAALGGWEKRGSVGNPPPVPRLTS